jgi:hypothetical protein
MEGDRILGAIFILGGVWLLFTAFTASEDWIYTFVVAPLGKTMHITLARALLTMMGTGVMLGGIGLVSKKLIYVGVGMLIILFSFAIGYLI